MPERRRRRGGLTAQPHDAIIKFTFSQREHAAGLLRAALAPELAALIRWGTLKVEKIHFVDRGLRGRYADLLFSARMGDEPGAADVYMNVLLEHQSSVDPLMIFRMGSTMWRRWDQLVRDDPRRKTLPLIVPILIHHSETGWTAATAFEDLVAVPERARAAARRYIPCFELKLVDVSRDPSNGLVKQALTDLGRVVLWCLSVAGNRHRLEAEVDQITEELNALYSNRREIDALVAVLRYVVGTQPKVSAARITEMLETTARKGEKEVTMDVLDVLKREGRVEGRAQGRVEGGARVLLRQLAARFGPVPAEAKARILGATGPALARWTLRVLTAPTLEAVLGRDTTAKKTARKTAKKATRRQAARRPQRSAK
jgi:predicted transposase/invertase (TIGR01784 family)